MLFSFLLKLKFHYFIYPTIEKICYVVRWLNLLSAHLGCNKSIVHATAWLYERLNMVFTASLLGAWLRSGSVLLVKANLLACYSLAKALNEIFRFGVIVKR